MWLWKLETTTFAPIVCEPLLFSLEEKAIQIVIVPLPICFLAQSQTPFNFSGVNLGVLLLTLE